MAHQAAFKGLVGLQVISLQELPELVLFGNILLLLAPDQDYASHACDGLSEVFHVFGVRRPLVDLGGVEDDQLLVDQDLLVDLFQHHLFVD